MSFESNTNNEQDPAAQAIEKYLGGIKTGGKKIVGVEDFSDLMHVLKADLNTTDSNGGTIESGTGETYAYGRLAEEGEVTVIRIK